jgi:hypothetical protein
VTVLRSFRAIALLVLLVPGAAMAQGKTPAPGIRLGIGFGASGFRATCDACNSDMPIGLDREVTVGVTLSSRLEAGIALTGWTGRTEGYPEKESSILATLRGYPLTGRPLHLDLGAGFGRYRAAFEPPAGPKQTAAADGFAWSVGVGYDLGLGNDLTLVPQIAWRQIGDGPLTLNDVEVTTTGFRVVTVGAAVRWRALPFLGDGRGR